jgi:predicted Rossmann fold flavoprotein
MIIVGGGPAGLFAALSAYNSSQTVTIPASIIILEKNPEVGRKLIATGSGQCNLTQDATVDELLQHFGGHGRFLVPALKTLTPQMTMEFFSSWGLPLIKRNDNKVFPKSLKATDVRAVLLKQCELCGIQILNNSRVVELQKHETGFTLRCDDGKAFDADVVVITTGGLSYPTTGSTGDGYQLAKNLGHTIVQPHAALTGVSILNSTLGRCSGISFPNATITVAEGLAKGRSWGGSLLVTHTGLSGPLVINNSRDLASGNEIIVGFLTNSDGRSMSAKELGGTLQRMIAQQGSLQIQTILNQLELPRSFISWVLEELHIDGTRKAAEIGKKQLEPIIQAIVSSRFTISLKGCLEKAMVTAGGISLTEVNRKTMESLLVSGLYFAGEVLDIDGDTGGYNLQAAWSSGWLAGRAAMTSRLSALPS